MQQLRSVGSDAPEYEETDASDSGAPMPYDQVYVPMEDEK